MTIVDLHGHPSFYSPGQGRNVPSIRDIVVYLFDKGINMCAISAYNSSKALDKRFHYYADNLSALGTEFSSEYNKDEGYIRITKKSSQVPLILLNSQEIETVYDGRRADINVIGVKDLISGGKSTDETVKIARDLGGVVGICHPISRCGVGIKKTLSMLDSGQADFAEAWNATVPRLDNRKVSLALAMSGRNGIATSDAHYYTQYAAAYTIFPWDLVENYSRENLRKHLKAEDYETIKGQIPAGSVFLHHTLPALICIAKDTLSGNGQLSKLKRPSS